jgi:hypothetical protein
MRSSAENVTIIGCAAAPDPGYADPGPGQFARWNQSPGRQKKLKISGGSKAMPCFVIRLKR